MIIHFNSLHYSSRITRQNLYYVINPYLIKLAVMLDIRSQIAVHMKQIGPLGGGGGVVQGCVGQNHESTRQKTDRPKCRELQIAKPAFDYFINTIHVCSETIKRKAPRRSRDRHLIFVEYIALLSHYLKKIALLSTVESSRSGENLVGNSAYKLHSARLLFLKDLTICHS